MVTEKVEREDIEIEVQEIRNHPEKIWSSKNRVLAGKVLEEIRKEYPEAVLCEWMSCWIPLNGSQREELRDMLEDIRENQLDELHQLQYAIRQLRVTEKEKLEGWLEQKIVEKEALQAGRDYSEKIQSCITEKDAGYFQLYQGIEEAAEILGETLLEEEREGIHKKSFRFQGREIIQVQREKRDA